MPDSEKFSTLNVDFKWTPEEEVEMVRTFLTSIFEEASMTWLEKSTHESIVEDVYHAVLNEMTISALKEQIKARGMANSGE